MDRKSSGVEPPARKPTVGDFVSLLLVRAARLQRARLTDANYDAFYEDFFVDKDVEAARCDHRRLLRQETIKSYLEEQCPSDTRLLDVGCGVGDLLSAMPISYELSGLEYATSSAERARKLLGRRVDVRQGDMANPPFPDSSQDACVCLEVLEHVPDDVMAVRGLARVLKSGGILIASVPYQYYWPDYKITMGHYRHYTRTSFLSLLEGAGFQFELSLPNYPNWHLKYSRGYSLIRANEFLFGRFTGTRSPYRFCWPWSSQASISKLAERLRPLKELDELLDYDRLETSTLLALRKR